MTKRFPSSLTYIERCAYEVQWYEKHGKYPDRIKQDYLRHKYVQSDFLWNRYQPSKTEHVNRAIADFMYERVTGIKK